MTEKLVWGEEMCFAGDTYSVPNTHEVITVLDMLEDNGKAYVVLKQHSSNPELWEARDFAYYVESGYFTRTTTPVHEVGDRFTHNYNNDTVEVIAVAPSVSSLGERHYYVMLINDQGEYMFTDVNETYLNNCIPMTKAEEGKIERPLVPIDAEFPKVSYRLTTP